MRNGLALVFVLVLVTSSLMMVESASAQSTPKPSVPDFTVKFVDRSYTVEESSQINPYTGKTEVIPAHQVQNYTIELTINYQHITPAMERDFNAEFRYDINVKGHFAKNWTIMYSLFEGPKPSNSDHTIIKYELVSSPTHPEQGFELRSFFDDPIGSNTVTGIPPNSKLDFRVRIIYGAMLRNYNPDATDQLSMYPYVFVGETSDWSNTQTINIPDGAVSTSTPNPTTPTTSAPTSTITPTPPDTNSNSGNSITLPLNILIITIAMIVLIGVALSVLLFLRHRKISKLYH
jgi:hypothetical protein